MPDSNIKRLSVRLADELARHNIDVGPADVLAALAATDMILVQADRSPAADAYRESLDALHQDLYRELPNNGNG